MISAIQDDLSARLSGLDQGVGALQVGRIDNAQGGGQGRANRHRVHQLRDFISASFVSLGMPLMHLCGQFLIRTRHRGIGDHLADWQPTHP